MVAFRFEAFGGAVPIVASHLLPPNTAALAVNTDLDSGEVKPFREPKPVYVLPDPIYRKAFRFSDGAWLPLRSDMAVVYPSPLVNDQYSRFIRHDPADSSYLMQNSRQRIIDNDPWLRLGIPPPSTAPSVVHSAGSGAAVTRAYVYTYVNFFGEESQPSLPTVETGTVGGTWTISGFASLSSPSLYGVVTIRIYRAVVSAEGTAQFYRVDDIAYGTPSYDDTRPDSDIALESRILQSATWAPPEKVDGIVPMPNGFFAAWRGRDIMFSEPYRPWAWPPDYILSVPDRVVGCGVAGAALVVLTESRPVIMSGPRPASMAVERLDIIEPCTNPGSIFSAPEGVYFAGVSGLMLVSPPTVQSISAPLISQRQWVGDYGSDLRSVVVTERFVFGLRSRGRGFVVYKNIERPGVVSMWAMPEFTFAWQDFYSERVYAQFDGSIYELFSVETALSTCGWRSKEFIVPDPVNFGALVVHYRIPDGLNVEFRDDIDEEPSEPPGTFSLWTDQAALYNYVLYGAVPYAEAPPPGELPPGVSGSERSGWPDWYGLSQAPLSISDLSGAGLPEDIAAYVVVRANRQVVWQRPVLSGVMYRLPSGFKDTVWQVDIIARVPVLSLQIAETPQELSTV